MLSALLRLPSLLLTHKHNPRLRPKLRHRCKRQRRRRKRSKSSWEESERRM